VTEASINDEGAMPILIRQVGYLIGVAGRAPSVHNTQPWRFTINGNAIDLYADAGRQLLVDPDSREMLISCGAALYGLRLAVRSLGYQPEVELLPELPARRPLARVRLGLPAPMTAEERKMLVAGPHRHTHRGPFEVSPLPAGLFTQLREDARAEGATLTEIIPGPVREELMALVADCGRSQECDSRSRADTLRWSRDVASTDRDGVPAHAFRAAPGREPDRLPQRDFDLGRGIGRLPVGGPAPAVTAVLCSTGDSPEDWLHAGQALYRLLLRAASRWVFASLNTQPLEDPSTRTLIAHRLALPGAPQMLLSLGVSRTARPTPRRAADDLIDNAPGPLGAELGQAAPDPLDEDVQVG
jgi:hypothetical protein